MTSVADPLLVQARSRPGELAVESAEVRWSWADLAAAAGAAADALSASGIAEGDRVAVLAGDGPGTVALVHGVRLIGAVLVPLNRRAPTTELVPQAAAAQVRVVVHDEPRAAAARAIAAETTPAGILTASLDALLPSLRPPVGERATLAASLRDEADADAVAAILFTSGTTGSPKGAMLTLGNQLASVAAWAAFLAPQPTDRWLTCLPFHHVAGLAMILRCAVWGVPLELAGGFDPAGVWQAIEAGISHVSIVGSTLGRLADAQPAGPVAPTLRAVLVGGEGTPVDVVRAARSAGLPVVLTYGATETASGVTALPPNDADRLPGSSGRALPGIELRISAGGALSNPGDVGEIQVRGGVVFAGYDGQPAATAGAFDDGWLRTGDLGSLDASGYLTVAARRDDLIVSGGENVYPAEVEAVLRAHPAIADAVVVGRADPRWGAVPVAAVVVRQAATTAPPTDAMLSAYCRERLAGYKVPVAFHRVVDLPRTSSGKARRDIMRAELAPSR